MKLGGGIGSERSMLTRGNLLAISAVSFVSLFMPLLSHAAEDKADLAKLFGTPPQFGQASLSPNGKYLAFIEPIDGVDNVLVSPLDSSGTASRFAIADSQAVGVAWHNDAQLIARLRISSKPSTIYPYYLSDTRFFALSPGRQMSVVALRTDSPGFFGGTSVVDLMVLKKAS
jgi:hypothetical protein